MTPGRAVGAFPCFALLWAQVTLVHQLSFTFWWQTRQGGLLTFATCLVVLKPRCLVRVVLQKFVWFRRYETFAGPMDCTH